MHWQRSQIISLFQAGLSASDILKQMKNENINRMFIYRTIKRFKDTQSVNDRPRSGRPKSARTPKLKNNVQCRIRRNPRRSIRKLARDFSVNHETMRNLVRKDLGLKSYKRKAVHHLSEPLRVKRLERSKKLLCRVGPETQESILFSDEKIFTIEEVTNLQNDRILAKTPQSISEKNRLIDRVQKPLSVMVWAGVSANSRTNLVFVPQGVKINAQTYLELILEPEIQHAGYKLFKNRPWLFQQDSAPAHSANLTQNWLRTKNIDFIDKNEWPPSSPDLNPLDYSIWANLEARACPVPHKSLSSLKAALKREWDKMPQEELRHSVLSFRKRLQSVVDKKGGYIEL